MDSAQERAIKTLMDIGIERSRAEKIILETVKSYQDLSLIPDDIRKQLEAIIQKNTTVQVYDRLYVVIATDSETPHSPEIDIYPDQTTALKKKQKWLDSGYSDGDDPETDADGVDTWVSIEEIILKPNIIISGGKS